MASGSMRDTGKALNTAFSASSVPVPLPKEIQQILESFLEKYQDIDDHDSQRLQEELLVIYRKHFSDNIEKTGPFVNILRQLRPAIIGEHRLIEWWNLVIRPVIDGVGHKRKTEDDANDFVQSILDFDADEDKSGERARLSNMFLKRVLNAYLARTKLLPAEQDRATVEDEYVRNGLESVLANFGRRKPKNFLLSLDSLLVAKEHRAQALYLLSAFLKNRPPHIYVVDDTQVIQHLLKCLLLDTSVEVMSMALTALMMFLTHIPATVVKHLPKLFLVYSRLLCWDLYGKADPDDRPKDSSSSAPALDGHEKNEERTADSAWQTVSDSAEIADTPGFDLHVYFTLLYGLYPLNFMAYIRKPRKYLKTIHYPNAERLDLDQAAIKRRSEPYRQLHLLHPNFFNTTAEEELTENRWLKSDAAEVLTECMRLSTSYSVAMGHHDDIQIPPNSGIADEAVDTESIVSGTAPGAGVGPSAEVDVISVSETKTIDVYPQPEPTAAEPDAGPASEQPKGAARKFSQTSNVDSPPASSFGAAGGTALPKSPLPSSNANAEMRQLPGPAKNWSSLRKSSTTSSMTSGAISLQLDASTHSLPQVLSSNSHIPSDAQAITLASLQREIMVLRDNLNFERYLKHQHLVYVGQLQRKHIREVAVERETQNLINTNKALKTKLNKASESFAQLKKETVTSRNQFKKWEGELTSKLRTLRDEKKQWLKAQENVRLELEKAREESARLHKMVVEREAKDRRSQEQLQNLESDMADLDRLHHEIQQLRGKLRGFEAREMVYEQAKAQQDDLRRELEAANLQLQSRDLDLQKARMIYDHKIADLESAPRRRGSGPVSPSVQQMIDSTLSTSASKNVQLKKAYNRLLNKYTALELRMQIYEAEREAAHKPAFGRHEIDGGDDAPEALSPTTYRPPGSFGRGNLNSPSIRAHGFADSILDDDRLGGDPIGGYQSPSSGKISDLSRTPPSRSTRPYASYDSGPPFDPLDPPSLEALPQESPPFAPHPPYHTTVPSTSNLNSPKLDSLLFGRGGPGAGGKKAKEGPGKKDKSQKSGGFRGLKGIM